MADVIVPGNQFDIGIALQTAKGVTVADANVQFRFPVTGGGLNAEQVVNVIEETTSQRVRNTSFVGAVNVDGAPALAARPDVLGLLLHGICGLRSDTGAADPWSHVYTLGATQPFFTLWKRIGPEAGGGYYEKYRDCKIASLQLASSAEGILIATPTFVGLRVFKNAAAATAVNVDIGSTVFMHSHGDGTMLLGGVNVGSISDFSLTIGGELARIRGNSLYGSDVAEQLREITIDTTSLVDWSRINTILYGSAAPAGGAAPSGTVPEVAIDYKYTIPGAPERSLQIVAPRVQLSNDNVDPNTDGAPLMMVTHQQVYQPVGGGSAMTATLKNGLASYPAAP